MINPLPNLVSISQLWGLYQIGSSALEFVGSERQEEHAPAEGFWFTELLKLNLLASNPHAGTEEEVKTRQKWLRDWGYGTEHEETLVEISYVRKIIALSTALTYADRGIATALSALRFREQLEDDRDPQRPAFHITWLDER